MTDKIRVLYVDTDDEFFDIVSNFLEDRRENLEIYTEDNAQDGLKSLGEKDIDCVISDYKMPEMDGLEFLEEVRDRYPDLPFILFTGKGSEEIASEAIRAGVTDYLQKGAGKGKYEILANRIENAVSQYRAEKKAQRSKERLETIVGNMPVVLFALDEEGNFTLSEGKGLKKIGLEPGEVVGQNALEVYEEKNDIYNHIQKALEGEELHTNTEVAGTYFENWYQPIENGGDESVIGVSVDVTDQKEFEQELRESKRKIEELHEITSEMMAVDDEEEVYDLGVKATERVLDLDICSFIVEEGGYLVSKAKTEGMEEKGHDRLLVDGESVAAKTYRNEESYIIEDIEETDEGKPAGDFFRSVISVPIGDLGVFQAASEEPEAFDDEDVELAELLMSNVNEALQRVRYEEKLKRERDRFEDLFERLEEREEEMIEERDKFAALFENVPEAVVDMRFEDGEPIIENVNPAFEEVFGYDANMMEGEHLDDYIVPPEREEEAEDLNQKIMDGEKLRKEVRRRTKDGMRHFLLQVVPYDVGEESARGYGVYTDITERKERQRRLQVLNRVLRHNLRNEMNVILGHAQLLKMDMHESDPRQKVERIETKAEEITDLSDKAQQIEQIVEKTENTQKEINVVDVIRRNTERYESRYPDAEIEMEVSRDVYVRADNQLSVAVNEVIENAIEHNNKPNPKIDISVKNGKRENGYVSVEIADNGPGIPEQERDVLIEGQETPLHHGSGLGLWLVNWIVNKSGGELYFDDNEPEGSIVTFRLPVVKEEETGKAPA